MTVRARPAASHVDESPEGLSPAVVEAATAWLTACRAVFIDIPLIWTMELSRFGSSQLEAQIRHCAALVRCTNLCGVVDEQTRFARQSLAELGDEVEALAKEARVAVAA